MGTQPIRVMLIENDLQFRQTIYEVLNSSAQHVCVASCQDAETAMDMIASTQPDVILMDIDLGESRMDGIQSAASIKKQNHDCMVVMHTVFDDDDKILRAIMAGADGYIVKGISNVYLLESIDKVVQEDFPMSPGLARRIKEMFRQLKEKSSVIRFLKGKAIPNALELTPIEERILDMMIENTSRKNIAASLNLKIDALKYHIKEIYRKIKAHGKQKNG